MRVYRSLRDKRADFQQHGPRDQFCDPSTGKTLWEQRGLFDKRTVSSSLVAGGLLIGTCGSGGGGNYLVAVKPGITAKGGKPSPRLQAAALHPLRPHKSGQGQSAFPLERRRHRDLCGGQDREDSLAGTRRGPFFGSPVWAEGRLFCISTTGKVVVIAASKEFRPIAVNDLEEDSNATPALAGDRIYFRRLAT